MKRNRSLVFFPLVFLLVLLGQGTAFAGGKSLYEKGQFEDAKKAFLERQVRKPKDLPNTYNLGNAHYRLQSYEDAEKSYLAAAASSDPKLSFRGFYNLGNTLYQEGRLEEAVAAYKKALEIDPNDEDAKHNLAFVEKQLQKRQQESEEQKKSGKSPEKKNDQEKDQSKNESSQSKPDQKPGDKPSPKNEADRAQGKKDSDVNDQRPAQDQVSPSQEATGPMSKSQAEAMLQNMQEGKRSALRKNRSFPERAQGGKDW